MASLDLNCGIDEAGRGPWAGPVTAAAVVLDPSYPIDGLTDSKKLTEKARLRLETEIQSKAIAWSLGWASADEIDAVNIRQATHLAMRRAVAGLRHQPSHLLVDGNDLPDDLPYPARAIVQGDLIEPAISAASILAKTARDRLMKKLCARYPGYAFSSHKGYGTAAHAAALARLGPSPVHRMSFAPVRKAMAAQINSASATARL